MNALHNETNTDCPDGTYVDLTERLHEIVLVPLSDLDWITKVIAANDAGQEAWALSDAAMAAIQCSVKAAEASGAVVAS